MTFCYSPFGGKKKIKQRKFDKLHSFSVCEKQAAPYFVLSQTLIFPNSHHVFLTTAAKSSMAGSKVHREEVHF